MSAATLTRLHAVSPAEDIDLVLEYLSPGDVLVSTDSRRMGDHPGTISEGGVGTTLLDVALATAVQSRLQPGQSYRLVDFAVTMVHADQPLEGRLEAAAQVVRSGGGSLVATGSVRAGGEIRVTGRLVARVAQRPDA
jgi:acyl-coenzyme A thioesterase PaaI-like protein